MTHSEDSAANRAPMTAFWLCAWAGLLACGWLLPNHYLPWSTFHMDAWVASALTLAVAAVIVRTDGAVQWHGMAVVAAAVTCLPLLQYATGLVLLKGTAWINTAYLLGFVLAVLAGSKWEWASPGQMMDGLFLAVGMAAILSVGFQLHQWLYLEVLETWVMPDNYSRPFANFGQPNQLGTFHLWGLLALGWAVLRGYARSGVAQGAAAYLLFGLALTASRASWLGVGVVTLAVWCWRKHLPDRRAAWVITALAAYFAVCVVSVSALREVLLGGSVADLQALTRATMVSENRPAVWAMFFDAAWHRPWFGYGWGQVALAQVTVALDHTPKFAFFGHAHNLPLDLVLWCGIPAGLLISLWLVRWFWVRLRSIDSAQNALLMTLLLVTTNHALLELPLHHAYFLLPVGLVIGVLDQRMAREPVFTTARWTMALLWLALVSLLVLFIRDYSRIEPEYQKLRFEWAHIKTDPARSPEVILLNQFPSFLRLVRIEPTGDMAPAQLQWMREITGLNPSPATFEKLALALALNGQPQEAGQWLRKMCAMAQPLQCEAVRREWTKQARHNPLLAAVAWPAS